MAAATLAQPGSKFGPCADKCKHIDCGQTRAMALQVCRFCGVTIGYDKRFYSDPDDQDRKALVHAICLEESIEQERSQ